jgi:hypothetical protein
MLMLLNSDWGIPKPLTLVYTMVMEVKEISNPSLETNDHASLTMFDRFDCGGIHWQDLASESQGKPIL